jgi:hypothetical protein
MEVSSEVLASYASGKDAGAQALLATKPIAVQRIIAARGMRVNAAKREANVLAPARSMEGVLNAATHKASRLNGAALLSAAAKGVEHFHKYDHKPATAIKVNRALKHDDAPAVRYALDPKCSGSLVSLKMRVRRNKHQGPTPGQNGPRKATDVIAARMCDARSCAIRDIEAAVNGFETAPNARLRAKCVSRVRGMLHTWAADPAVVQAARLCGWNV